MPVWLLLDGGCADAETGGEGRGRKGTFLQSMVAVVVEAIGIRNAAGGGACRDHEERFGCSDFDLFNAEVFGL